VSDFAANKLRDKLFLHLMTEVIAIVMDVSSKTRDDDRRLAPYRLKAVDPDAAVALSVRSIRLTSASENSNDVTKSPYRIPGKCTTSIVIETTMLRKLTITIRQRN